MSLTCALFFIFIVIQKSVHLFTASATAMLSVWVPPVTREFVLTKCLSVIPDHQAMFEHLCFESLESDSLHVLC